MKRKKMLAIFLASALIVSSVMPAFAADVPQAEELSDGQTVSETQEDAGQAEENSADSEEDILIGESKETEAVEEEDSSSVVMQAEDLEKGIDLQDEGLEVGTVISELEDFNIEGTVVKGFSESGLKKLDTIKDVIIPEKNKEGEAITEIGGNAFNNKGLVSVVFPGSLKVIGMSSFTANNLKEIILPDSVTTVGQGAFSTNFSVEKVKLSSAMSDIPNGFLVASGKPMNSFTELVIPEGIVTIGNNAFAGHNLKSLKIPASVETIGNNAFSQLQTLRSLEKVEFSEGLISIGSRAFQNTKLNEVELPATVVSVDKNAFNGCVSTGQHVKVCVGDKEQFEKLSSQITATSPHKIVYHNLQGTGWSYDDFEYDGAKVVGWSEKGNQTKLTNKKLIVPNVNPETEEAVTEIGASAFENMSTDGMVSAELPDTIEVIGAKAFAGNNLSQITIPATVTAIAKDAFADNSESVILEVSNKEFLETLKKADLENVRLMTHISACEISVDKAVYTGKELTPKVTIKDGEKILVDGVDYTIDSYDENINAGTAKVHITGNGEYVGSIIKYFTIEKAKKDITVTLISNNIFLGETIPFFVEGTEGRPLQATCKPNIVNVNSTKLTMTGDDIGTATITIFAKESENYQKSESVEISVTVKGNMEDENSKWNYSDFTYEVDTNETTKATQNVVTGWSDSGTQKKLGNKELIIPDINSDRVIDPSVRPKQDKIITIIRENAFANSGDISDGITSVKIPEKITTIENRAFAGNRLTEVRIPEKVSTIAQDAFSDNENIVRLVLCRKDFKDRFLELDNVSLVLDISTCSIDVSDMPYTGSAIVPEVIVKDGDTVLTEGKDYVIDSCTDNVKMGRAKVVIKGIGDNFAGSVDKYFMITKGDETSSVSPSSPEIKVNKISISGNTKKIAAGKKIQLTAKVFPENATNKSVKWVSGNPKVATVNSAGLVTVKKKTGGKKVVIRAIAADGSKVAGSYKITSMRKAVKKITISGKKSVKAGKSLKLKAKVSPSKKTSKEVTWTSSNKKYATVSASGKVKTYKAGKGKKVKITATAKDGSKKKKTIVIKIK